MNTRIYIYIPAADRLCSSTLKKNFKRKENQKKKSKKKLREI